LAEDVPYPIDKLIRKRTPKMPFEIAVRSFAILWDLETYQMKEHLEDIGE